VLGNEISRREGVMADWRQGRFTGYSYRSATLRSIFVARLAGAQQAAAETRANKPITPEYVMGSSLDTPNSNAIMARVT
jgi:hypothetical protein